jgi:hypothetical protein
MKMICDQFIDRNVIFAQPAGKAYLFIPRVKVVCVAERYHTGLLLSMQISYRGLLRWCIHSGLSIINGESYLCSRLVGIWCG